jgi:hypothetical protein
MAKNMILTELDYTILHQTTRDAVHNFDNILAHLLTQGNTFLLAVLSLPLVTNMAGKRGAILAGLCFLFSIILFFANYLYRSLLRCAVRAAEEIESTKFKPVANGMFLTAQLETIPFSATKGSTLLYLGLPVIWFIVATSEMVYFIHDEPLEWVLVFTFCGLFVIALCLAVFFSLRKGATCKP